MAGCDTTVVAQSVRVAPHRSVMREALADVLEVMDPSSVSVKATTTDGLGFVGREEGIAATALTLLRSRD